ncbi:MAG: FAD-dependent tricarballylate dehydrogenase TcuA [Deltaproteobacteria bacterium]|nr:MAG: FAD-dependent tricarballylate dehydrogenase TcuA [Deltaproteobacteria bacterium]RLC19214.1 MAG: FAD-dependent tricarballylate dehydrogenase TcuA [Deltaproteobacteria bacterium]
MAPVTYPDDDSQEIIDVLVIGGGNAALCAAITARESGAAVMLLEGAPKHFRGGNSRHTRNLRYVHNKGNEYLNGPYLEDEFWKDLLQVTEGNTDERLARHTIRQSEELGIWMEQHGCRFQPSMRGTLHLARTNAFFLGGGKALMNAYYSRAEKIGVNIFYESHVYDLEIKDGRFVSARVKSDHIDRHIQARSVVIASGGFQADIAWLKQYWGEAASNFIIRGTPYDKGRMLKVLLDNGAESVGDPKQCHAVAVDARSPRFDGGIVTRLDCVPFGITVNKFANRFYDEGENFWPKRYAIWGRLVARQEDQIAYSIIDSKSIDLFMPSVFKPFEAESIQELAGKLSLSSSMLEKTVANFNASVQEGSFDPGTLDDCRTAGLDPPKSHWARPIDRPPFYGYPLRPGITFTYLGVRVNDRAQIMMQGGNLATNMFAAGEIMSGNILGKGYMAGFGMTIGTVFGRIAGKEAADHALEYSS